MIECVFAVSELSLQIDKSNFVGSWLSVSLVWLSVSRLTFFASICLFDFPQRIPIVQQVYSPFFAPDIHSIGIIDV